MLRPVEERDLDSLFALSRITGGGLTTLPPDRDLLAARIAKSRASFAAAIDTPGDDYYLFACEDTETGRVVGTSGIFATVGLAQPFYSYRILKLTQQSHAPEITVHCNLLQLVNDFAGATEIGTLFLDPEFRGGANGALLSRGRYLMMAAHPGRFAEKVMAEVRGRVDEAGRSPVWEAIGRHFFGMDFHEADRLNGMGNNQFIADLMPKFPIYVDLLPADAQAAIGQPHEAARGAVRLLEAEGYRFAGAVDIFDGGPCYEVPLKDIRTLRAARRFTIDDIGEVGEPAETWLVARPELPEFRIVRCRLGVRGEGAVLPADAARALGVTRGDDVHAAPLGTGRRPE